jgi:hypothetical protein
MKVEILEQSCFACPTIYDVLLDGKEAYVRYRWGIISLNTEKETIIEEKIGDEYDGVIEKDDIINWLKSKNYKVDAVGT